MYSILFDLDVTGGPYIVYVRPKMSIVKEMITSHPKTGITEIRMKNSSLKALLQEELSDLFVIDMNKLDPKCASDALNMLASQIMTDTIDSYDMNGEKNLCKAKSIISVSVGKISSIGKQLLDRIQKFHIKWKDIFEVTVDFSAKK